MKHYAKPSKSPQPLPTSDEEVSKFWNRKFNITQFLFDKQLAFVEDSAAFKVAVCSRRSGKTIACAADLIHTAIMNKGVVCLYITLSRNNAKKIIWRDLKKINKDYDLGGAVNDVDMSITFQNESIIYLSGAKDASEIEKFRGLAIKKVYIDECQSFREYIKDLIDDIIAPALMDYAGTLCLIGTPGPVPAGYFHECAVQSDTWAKHSWTFFDNPHIPIKSGKTHQELLDRDLKRRGVSANDPSIQREWFGKWVLDSDSLILHYDASRNGFNGLPILPGHAKYSFAMGVDIGFNDADAIAIIAHSDYSPDTYLVEELVVPQQGITELALQIQEFIKKYDIYKIVMDTGGLGKKVAEELIRRYQLPIEAADKTRKIENLAILDDALRTGRFKATPTSRFAQDSYLVEKDRDKSKPDRIVISTRFHSDIVDAVLYAFKLSPAFAYTAPPKAPIYGSPEWARQQSSEMFEAELEGLQNEQKYDRYGRGDYD